MSGTDFVCSMSGIELCLRMDRRWAGGDSNRMRALAQELVGLQPEIIVTMPSTPATVAIQRQTRTIPIVFMGVADPVASGIVARLDRPSGNITGLANFEPTLGASGLSYYRRSGPASSGLQSSLILIRRPHRLICRHLRWRPGHSMSCQSLRLFIAM